MVDFDVENTCRQAFSGNLECQSVLKDDEDGINYELIS
jgi:hypothetical protein